MLDPELFRATRRIERIIRLLLTLDQTIEPSDFEGAMEDLKTTLIDLHEEDILVSAVMTIRGKILSAGGLPIEAATHLHNGLWSAGQTFPENSDDQIVFKRLASQCKPVVCRIFRGVLSGGDIFFTPKHQRYSLARIPDDSRKALGIRYSVNRKNALAIIRAYNSLVMEAQDQNNELMIRHWIIQRNIFELLVNHFAPRILAEQTPI